MHQSQTQRFKLPLLATGQSQKELFHNEALVRLDFLVHPVVQSVENDPALLTIEEGLNWLIDSAPSGEWMGRTNQIASWTSGGWRYFDPVDSMQLFVAVSQETAIFQNNEWKFGGSIVPPVGGSVVDVEARVVIDSILEVLKVKAIIAS